MVETPPKGIELEASGVPESESSDDDHFSDALEGRPTHSRPVSPNPQTKFDKGVDDSSSYAGDSGSQAHNGREIDADPDEIRILGARSPSREDPPPSPKPSVQVPHTLVEKADHDDPPSHNGVPDMPTYGSLSADTGSSTVNARIGKQSRSPEAEEGVNAPDSVPETLVSRSDAELDYPSHTVSHHHGSSDAPLEEERVVSEAPYDFGTSHHITNESVSGAEADDDFGDFDDFEQGYSGQPVEDFDDFDDFGDGFQTAEPATTQEPTRVEEPPDFPFPIVNFNDINTLSQLLDTTKDHLDTLFPQSKDISSLPSAPPIPDSRSIFMTDRSLSLWSQLVAPPPLQPPNWIKSRIRRGFLVSLGVPVDLDEILPASKQKKLVLPSVSVNTDVDSSSGGAKPRKDSGSQPSSASTTQPPPQSEQRDYGRSSRRRGPPPPPPLDMNAVRRLCATTDAALAGFTDAELRTHVKTLETVIVHANEVLQYWLALRESQMGEKEAFEGVIENLVKHARQVRK